MSNEEILAAVEEARFEISRINRAANETRFNPSATAGLDAVIRALTVN